VEGGVIILSLLLTWYFLKDVYRLKVEGRKAEMEEFQALILLGPCAASPGIRL